MMPDLIEAALWITMIFAGIVAMVGLATITMLGLAWVIEGVYVFYRWLIAWKN